MKYDKPIISKPTSILSFLQQKRQEKKFRQTIEMSATFILIVFFLIFAIRPTVVTISSLIADINTKKDLSDKYKKKINSVITAQTVYSQAQADYDLISSSLPNGYHFSKAATQIRGISQTSNIPSQKIGFSLSKETGSGQAMYYGYSFADSIDFNNIINLISQLNNNRRCIQITSLSLSAQGDQDRQDISVNSSQPKISMATQIFYWNNEQ